MYSSTSLIVTEESETGGQAGQEPGGGNCEAEAMVAEADWLAPMTSSACFLIEPQDGPTPSVPGLPHQLLVMKMPYRHACSPVEVFFFNWLFDDWNLCQVDINWPVHQVKGRRRPTPQNCPLTSTCSLLHRHTQHAHTTVFVCWRTFWGEGR